MVAGRSSVMLVACVLSLGAAAAPPAPKPVAGPVAVVVALAAFKPINADAASAWVGEGIRRGIELQLRRGEAKTGVTLVVRDLPADVLEPDAAMAAAVNLRADVIVVGSYQVAGNEVRATGRVMSVSTGKEIAFVSARSPLRTIFDLQDELGYQVRRSLLPEPDATPPAGGFEGSALDRSLDGGDDPGDGRAPRAERNPRNPEPPVSRENPGGWGAPGTPPASTPTPGGGDGAGGGYGGGAYGGWAGWGPYVPYVPYYVYPRGTPPKTPPGGGSPGGGASGGAGGSTTTPPADAPPARRPPYNFRNPDTRLPPPNP